MKALQNVEYTENGMETNRSSGSANIDFFYKIGGMRGHNESEIISIFKAAFDEDPLLAMKNLFCARDIRSGKGERRSARICIKWVADNHPQWLDANLDLVPKYGRWDDLFWAMDNKNWIALNAASKFIGAIVAKDGLAAKWAPRYGKSKWSYGQFMLDVMSSFEYSKGDRKVKNTIEAQYRRLLRASKTVEQQMSANQWGAIEFEKVPSQAMLKYRKTFSKKVADAFLAFLNRVKSGKSKIHASTMQPYQVVEKMAMNDTDPTLDAMWEARPNFITEGHRPIAMIDVSGSMFDSQNSVWKAISIGLDVTERISGPFKNSILAFSSDPSIYIFDEKMPVRERVKDMVAHSSSWGYSTNFIGALKSLLDKAIQIDLDPEEFPTHILVLSDMQFNPSYALPNSAVGAIDAMYAKTEYKKPIVVFWNLSTSKGVPATKGERGYVLVSGYSSSVMSSVFSDKIIVEEKGPTPEEVFLEAMSKYEDVSAPYSV